nr:hypothetical protein [Tanacetum cinerariifolium]
MKMEHYLSHTDYLIWQVIHNGNGHVSVTIDTNEMIKVLPPKTSKDVMAKEGEGKSRTTLLMALPKDHLAKFPKMADAKEMFQTLLSQLEIHGAGVSHEDANQRFLRSLPSSWSQVALIMRTKPGLDTLSFDDLYNNLRVFERDVKGTIASSSNPQNVAFVSIDNTSSTNNINDDDMEDMDLKWQLVLIRPKWNASIAIKWSILLETVELNGTKTAEEEMMDSKPSEYASCESDSTVETSTSMPEQVENASKDDPHRALKDKGIVDSGCSRHMTGNKAHLTDYQEFKGGSIAFGGNSGRITSKGKIKDGRFDFEDLYYVEELKHYNLFSMSHMCDKKNKVLFTHTDCLVLSLNFKLPDENQVLLKIPKQHNMYSFNLKNIDPYGDFACLFVKALIDESNKWHRRLGHVNFKSLNKLMKGNLVRGLPSKIFENDHTCVACQKGKQHKASCKAKKEETTPILKDFIRQPENQFNHKVKTIRSDNGTEFKNKDLIEFCGLKEAVNTACYVLNMVLVTKPQNKTPYELLTVENQANKSAGLKDANNSAVSQVEQIFMEELEKLKRQEKEANDAAESLRKEATHDIQNTNTSSTNLLNTVSTPLSTAGPSRAFNDGELSYLDDPSMPHLNDIYVSLSEGIFTDLSYDDEGVVTDFNNLETTININPNPITRIHSIHPKTQILRDLMSAVQTRSKVNKNSEAYALVWILVDLPFGKKAIGTKWVYRNKKDEKGVVVRNKTQLVAQGHRQEEEIDYDEVFASMARIKAISIFLAFASFMGFIVYHMGVKSAFLYGTIDEEVYVSQPLGFVDLKFPKKVYKVVKALYGLHQALRACVKTASTPIETQKLLVKDKEAADVDVTSKSLYLEAMKRIFRKSTTRGCQFLGRRLISWQCKKQTIVATSTTEAEYVAAAHCCGQVLWI